MNNTSVKRDQLWDDFLKRWPIESLPSLTLNEYSQPGTQDGFTYWLESKTESLGSVWGGSSFKFGIYKRSDKEEAKNSRGRIYGDIYAWYSKYGNTPEEAFESVHAEILKVALAAQNGDLVTIDKANLGEAIKWKLAFLYQNRDNLVVLPIYKAENLRAAMGSTSKGLPCSSIHQQLMEQRDKSELFAYADSLWQKSQTILAEKLTHQAALEYLQSRFQPIKESVKYMAGFMTSDQRQLGLVGRGSVVSIFLEPDAWPILVPGIKLRKHFLANTPRIHSLEANAPDLYVGNPADQVEVHTMSELIGLCDAYEEIESSEEKQLEYDNLSMKNGTVPLNQIFYGPPGTGKTYATIDAALLIVDPEFFANHPEVPGADWKTKCERRKALKQRFDELSKPGGLIRFVTFHQSFSYEDFVEGLRAETNDNKQLEYVVEPGVFKRLCDDARTQGVLPDIDIPNNPRIWKISINGSGPNSTKTYCFTHSEARIGWGETGDLREPFNPNEYYMSVGSGNQGTLRYFSDEIAKGDILVCLDTAETIAGVGVVTGDYYYEQNVPNEVESDYNHVRPVKWLYRDLQLPIRPINDDKQLVQKTVYLLERFTWAELLTHIEESGANPALPGVVTNTHKPHVLIIDEINRGNISRIFGELITLIESSKRAGALEALEVTLPYSKKPFSVPSNVYLIGTMNTADRSLAGLDIALRRRFTFKEMPPMPELLDTVTIDGVNIGQMLRKMNERIEVLLDSDHCLGHAYFISLLDNPSLEELSRIFRMSILPLLQEYFFEDWERISWVLNNHKKPDNQKFVKRASSDLKSVFGDDFSENVQDRRWHINKSAFGNIESYRGIL